MSDRSDKSKARLNSIFVLYVLVVVALVLGALALYEAWRSTPEQDGSQIVVGEPVTPEMAQAILDRANDTTEYAGLLLSFIEAASAIVGMVLVVGAYILRRSILDEFEQASKTVDDLERRISEREKALAARERELDELRKSLTDNMNDLLKQNLTEFEVMRQQARDSFRVVSLQLLAEQQVRAHNVETAIKTLFTAHELEPDNQATNYLLGYLHTLRRDFDKAIGYLQQALDQDASFTPAIAALGLALRRKGDAISEPERTEERNHLWSQAEDRLLKALGVDESLTDMEGESYYGTLGGLYRRQKRYPDALFAYEKACKVTPASSYPIINLAALHTHQGNTEEARVYFEKVLHNAELELDDDPRNMWTRMDYAQALLVLGGPEKALEQVRIVLNQNPERAVLETVCSGLRFLSEAAVAVEGLDVLLKELESALETLPDNDPAASMPDASMVESA